MFHKGEHFPEAQTALAVNAEANARRGKAAALQVYMQNMRKECRGVYLSAEALEAHHVRCKTLALEKYNSTATMGRADDLTVFRSAV